MTNEGSEISARAKVGTGFVAAAALAFAGFYVERAKTRVTSGEAPPAAAGAPAFPPRQGGRILFRSVAPGPEDALGRVAVAELEQGAGAAAPRPAGRALTELACVRVHFGGRRGVCLRARGEGGGGASLVVFDEAFSPVWQLDVPGLPSRARVSPDGRYAAFTVFVTGHSYDDVAMSTRTALVDLEARRFVVDDLERLSVTRNGAPFEAPSRNFWGVTFAPEGKGFHATLGDRGKTWLVAGDIASTTLEVLRENVECPSRSPDGRRIAFKKRVEGQEGIRLHALDLATLREWPLGETRSVDDQVEWLDDARILYKHGAELFVLPVEEGASPTVFLEHASSPAVVARRAEGGG